MVAGAIVVGAIKIYIRPYLLVIDMCRIRGIRSVTMPLMDDKISALGYTSTVRDRFPLTTQHLTRLLIRSAVSCVILYSPYMLLRMQNFEANRAREDCCHLAVEPKI